MTKNKKISRFTAKASIFRREKEGLYINVIAFFMLVTIEFNYNYPLGITRFLVVVYSAMHVFHPCGWCLCFVVVLYLILMVIFLIL